MNFCKIFLIDKNDYFVTKNAIFRFFYFIVTDLQRDSRFRNDWESARARPGQPLSAVVVETGIWQVFQEFCELGLENTKDELKTVFHLAITEG